MNLVEDERIPPDASGYSSGALLVSGAPVPENPPNIEPYYDTRELATLLNLKHWWIQEAIRQGLVSTATFVTERRLLRVRDVVDVIENTRARGGEK